MKKTALLSTLFASFLLVGLQTTLKNSSQELKAETTPITHETSVEGLFNADGSKENGWFFLGFTLSSYDATTAAEHENVNFDLSKSNMFTNIVDGEGNPLPYNSIRKNRGRVGKKANSYLIYLDGNDYLNPSFTTVTILKGTQFPSKAYCIDNNPEEYYVTKEDITFNYIKGDWYKEGEGPKEPQYIDTAVTAINLTENSNRISYFVNFTLTQFDYFSSPNFIDNILKPTDDAFTKILGDSSPFSTWWDSSRSHRWSTTASVYRIFLIAGAGYDFTNPGYSKITIPKQTCFMSKTTAEGGDPIYYRTTEDVSFSYNENTKMWVKDEIYPREEDKPVEVTSITLIEQEKVSTYYYMCFSLSDYDWKKEMVDKESVLQNNNWTLDKFSNIKKNVLGNGEVLTYDKDRGNRFRCGIDSYMLVVSGDISSHGLQTITVNEGTEFPTKVFGMGDNVATGDYGIVTKTMSFYVTEEDATFVLDDGREDNRTFIKESVYEAQLATLKVDAIDEMKEYRGGSTSFTINKNAYDQIISDNESAINDANTKTEVGTILSSAKVALDAIKSDAELLSEAKSNANASLQTTYDSLKTTRSFNLSELQTILINGKKAVNEATTISEVETAVAAYSLLMNDVKEDSTVISDAKIEITNYKGGANNYSLELTAYTEAKNDAFDTIDNAKDKTTIDNAVISFKTTIDGLKNDATLRSETIDAIDLYSSTIDLNKYSKENQTQISALIIAAKDDVANATSKAQLENIVQTLKDDIAKIPTLAPAKSGCGGTIIGSSLILFVVSLFGISLLIYKKKAHK